MFQSADAQPFKWPTRKLAISRCDLRELRQASGKRFTAGIVLYDGEEMSAGFGDGFYAVPIRTLWET